MALPTPQETRRPTVQKAEEILGGYFPVLDHGFVALVDYMGADEDVERAARVSYGYGTRKVSETRGLIRYLRRHHHTTPSEMVEFKFHCAMPIFVARQWIRHRTASVNEYSGRYSIMPLLFYKPEQDHFALQSATNKQGRAQVPLPGFDGHVSESNLYQETIERWEKVRRRVEANYEWLIGEDVARELARIDLPLSTYTQWYWKIDLHNLLHFLTLRVDPHAQWEIQEYGRVIAAMVKRVAPLSFEAWIDYQVMGAQLSRGELEALSRLVDADDNGISARQDAGASNDKLAELGLSPREVRELKTKLRPRPTPAFDLDLNTKRDAAGMRAAAEHAVAKHDDANRTAAEYAAPKRDDTLEATTATPSKTASTLEAALSALQDVACDDIAYDIYRAACVKEFEIVLEQGDRLVRKWLRPYFADARQVDRLHFKDVFRHAAKHGLVSAECSERWLTYRDTRDFTAQEYGEPLADEAIRLLSGFIDDANGLAESIQASGRSAQGE